MVTCLAQRFYCVENCSPFRIILENVYVSSLIQMKWLDASVIYKITVSYCVLFTCQNLFRFLAFQITFIFKSFKRNANRQLLSPRILFIYFLPSFKMIFSQILSLKLNHLPCVLVTLSPCFV